MRYVSRITECDSSRDARVISGASWNLPLVMNQRHSLYASNVSVLRGKARRIFYLWTLAWTTFMKNSFSSPTSAESSSQCPELPVRQLRPDRDDVSVICDVTGQGRRASFLSLFGGHRPAEPLDRSTCCVGYKRSPVTVFGIFCLLSVFVFGLVWHFLSWA